MIRSRSRTRDGGIGGSSAAFSPYTLPNKYAMFDASVTASITQSGGKIDQWSDISGNSRHATASATFRPSIGSSVSYNGVQVAQFNGSNVMSIASSTGIGNGNFSIYFVAQNTIHSSGATKTLIGSNTSMGVVYQSSNLKSVCGGSYTFASTAGIESSSHVGGCVRNGVLLTNIKDAVTANTVAAANNATASGLFIGGFNAATGEFTGNVCEVLIYDTAHDAATSNQIISYLNNKWIEYNGLALTGATSTTLISAATQNRLAYGSYGEPSTDRHYFIVPKSVPVNYASFAINLHHWYRTSTVETDITGSITFSSVYMYNDAGTISFPLTFSGSRSVTLASGDNDILSDIVLPADVGQSEFLAGTWWIKGIINFTAGNGVGYMRNLTADVAGSQSGYYLASATTPSTTDATGVFTFTGTAPVSSTRGYTPILLGTPSSATLAYVCIGDSIADYNLDASNNIHGEGFFQRAVASLNKPSINMAMNGSATNLFCLGTKWRKYIKYCNRAVDELGTNDVGTGNTANVRYIANKCKYLWGAMRYFGVSKIIRTKLLVRTTTTDNWATTANQTVAIGWDAGQNVATLNGWFATYQTAGYVDYVSAQDSIRDGVSIQKFKVDGTAFKYTTDGLHPSASGHALLATDLSTSMTTVA